ncbi:MAG: M10 family metallopeptidase domain-containing protein [Myxococcota bacterium]|nr:M10 family metallopeptidase domain-containing protein [Myxococcota bacterium]
MAKHGVRRSPAMMTVCAMTAAAVCGVSHNASAFELKHTPRGQPLRWANAEVSYVIDSSIEESVPGGADAVSSAVHGWIGALGIPALSSGVGKKAKAGLDGQNSVLLAPDGFAPAGNALAITVTSYDAATGNIVDADVVVNGIYDFAVLADRARAKPGVFPIATDGASSDDSKAAGKTAFDLVHVVSHEIGHTLGLADEQSDESALMYAFTMPGDASHRLPSADDFNGVKALYGAAPARAASPAASPGQSGCGLASVAESPTRAADVWGASALVAGAGIWLMRRRSGRGVARAVLPVCGALAVFVAAPMPARSLPYSARTVADAAARVTDISTSNVGGLFETTIELAPIACRKDPCPSTAWAHAWGGTVAGITQRVGNDSVPSVGDVVNVAFFSSEPRDVRVRPFVVVVQRH